MTFDLARYQDPLTIQRVLLDAKTIAVVGLSGNPLRASNFVGFYLQRHGYRVIPVNPREPEIFGERSYASLRDVPVAVDIVDVFRAPAALPEIARDAVVSVHRDQRGRRAHRGARRAHGRDGSLPQGRARPLCRTHALARFQH